MPRPRKAEQTARRPLERRAVLYIRSVHFYSLDLQTDVLYRYAEAHGITIVDLVVDRWSGGMSDDILKSLIRRKKKINDFDLLLATEITRLTEQSMLYAVHLCRQIRQSGIEVQFAHKGHANFTTTPSTTKPYFDAAELKALKSSKTNIRLSLNLNPNEKATIGELRPTER